MSPQLKRFLRWVGVGTLLLFATVLLLGTLSVLTVGILAARYLTHFSYAANITPKELISTVKQGWNTLPQQTNGRINILVLGTDQLTQRGDVPALTDTMLLASVNLKTAQVSLISFPRDLWITEYQTRINSLYYYGQERYPNRPEQFPEEVIEQLSGVQIHHVVVLKLSSLSKLVDALGGIDVQVAEGFVDPQFPRTDVDITVERDPAKLYETVEFKTGTEHMFGERVLKYVRSRHAQGNQGDDQARSARQQQVIMAIVHTLQTPDTYRSPLRAGKLYLLYTQEFASGIPLTELVGIARALFPSLNQLAFTTNSLSIHPDDPQGVITHPPVQKYKGQWVYEVRDAEQFKLEVQRKLGVN